MTFEEFKKDWYSDSEFIEAHTSGSTGNPKTILLEKQDMRESALRTLNFFFPQSATTNWRGIRLHSCVSCDYIGGKMMGVRGLVSDADVSFEIPSNRPLKDLGKDEIISLLSVVPSQLLYLLQHTEDLPRIRKILVGGSPLSGLQRQLAVRSGLEIWESYGMTETCSHIALRRVTEMDNWFKPLPGIKVSLSNRDTLVIDIKGKTFVTNDIAELMREAVPSMEASVDDATGFRILGRADNVIITGGLKVFPEEVEKKLSALLPFPFAITGLKDSKWGEAVVLATTEIFTDTTETELLDRTRPLLSRQEIPKCIITIPALPMTPNGKIDRRQLRQMVE